jgi:hypothetical protein
MTQPQLIQSILKELNFNNDTKECSKPAFSSTILKDGKGKSKHVADWSYRHIIGKLNFIASSCRPELSCAVHQAARFSQDPRINHTKAVKQISRYGFWMVFRKVAIATYVVDYVRDSLILSQY